MVTRPPKRPKTNVLIGRVSTLNSKALALMKWRGMEPQLDDLIDGDVVKSMMASDHVKREDLKRILDQARDQLPK